MLQDLWPSLDVRTNTSSVTLSLIGGFTAGVFAPIFAYSKSNSINTDHHARIINPRISSTTAAVIFSCVWLLLASDHRRGDRLGKPCSAPLTIGGGQPRPRGHSPQAGGRLVPRLPDWAARGPAGTCQWAPRSALESGGRNWHQLEPKAEPGLCGPWTGKSGLCASMKGTSPRLAPGATLASGWTC